MSADPRAWIAAMRSSHDRLARLAAPLAAQQLTRPSYASEWTIAQVLSHLGSGAEIAKMTLAEAQAGGAGTLDRSVFAPVWARWDAKSPQQQAADSIAAAEANLTMLEGLSDADLAGMRFHFSGMRLDAASLLRVWLGEHALHTWDIEVALDPSATVAAGPASLLAPDLPAFAAQLGRPAGQAFQARLRGTDPDVDFLLDVRADGVSLARWPGERPATAPSPGELTMPSEALVRLVYGRLDPAHTPPVLEAGGASLDQVRAVFPGF